MSESHHTVHVKMLLDTTEAEVAINRLKGQGAQTELVQKILDKAKNTLQCGHTWPEEYRVESLEEALQEIINLCQEEVNKK